MTGDDGRGDNLFALGGCDGTYLTARRNNFRPLDNLRAAVFIQHGYKRFAYSQLSEHGLSVQFGVLPKRFGGRFHRLLIARSKGAQGVLHAVAELAKNNFRNVEWILADEVNADTFGT